MSYLTMLRVLPLWMHFLGYGLMLLASVVPAIVLWGEPAKRRPVREASVFFILSRTLPFFGGLVLTLLFTGPVIYERELAQGILTCSSVLFALSSVLLGIARFSTSKNELEDLSADLVKAVLFFSLAAGLVCMFLVLFWYAKGDLGLLKWSCLSFFTQVGYVLTFLCFPKYYLH